MDSAVSGLQKQGTRYRLFVAVSPGLEAILAEELGQLGFQPRSIVGGAELGCDFDGLMRLCLWSRLAESIRLRLKAFRALNFVILERELARLPWHAYLRPELPTHFSVTCHKSRLYHSDAIAERCQHVIESRLMANLPRASRAEAAQTVWLRVTGDWVQTSIDVSGERLHRRGYRTHVGEAPLRETLAAAMVQLVGAAQEQTAVWDPFCGSGTLLLEWLSARRGLAPGGGRSFAFEAWPIFAPYQAAFAALRAAASTPSITNHELIAVGSDLDEKVLAAAEENAKSLGVAAQTRWIHGDFESAVAKVPAHALVLTNPPYGKRVGQGDDLSRLYRRFEKVLRERRDLRPVVLACGLPNFRFELPWQRLTQMAHGGLKVTLLRLDR